MAFGIDDAAAIATILSASQAAVGAAQLSGGMMQINAFGTYSMAAEREYEAMTSGGVRKKFRVFLDESTGDTKVYNVKFLRHGRLFGVQIEKIRVGLQIYFTAQKMMLEDLAASAAAPAAPAPGAAAPAAPPATPGIAPLKKAGAQMWGITNVNCRLHGSGGKNPFNKWNEPGHLSFASPRIAPTGDAIILDWACQLQGRQIAGAGLMSLTHNHNGEFTIPLATDAPPDLISNHADTNKYFDW